MKHNVYRALVTTFIIFSISMIIIFTASSSAQSTKKHIINEPIEIQKEYFVTIKIKQTSYSLDIWEHAKNAMNSFEIKVPTTKKFYDSVKVGEKLSDNWNKGSFVFRGGLKGFPATISEKTSK